MSGIENVLDLLYDLCRLCLERNGNHNLFAPDSSFVDEIAECAGVQVELNEQLPKTICDVCVERLRMCKTFREIVSKTDNRLHTLLNGAQETADVDCELLVPNVVIEAVDEEKNHKKKTPCPQTAQEEKSSQAPRISVRVDIFNGSEQGSTAEDKGPDVEKSTEITGPVTSKFFDKEDSPIRLPRKRKTKRRIIDNDSSEDETKDIPVKKEKRTGSEDEKKDVKVKIAQMTCDICGKMCPNPRALYHHKRGHIRNHACVLCSKAFSIKNDLTKHMRTHTGEKPFPCDVCGKAFAQAGSLKYHKETHFKNGEIREEEENQSEINSETINSINEENGYSEESTLEEQAMNYTGTESESSAQKKKKPRVCKVCQKTFETDKKYRQHKRNHHRILPFC